MKRLICTALFIISQFSIGAANASTDALKESITAKLKSNPLMAGEFVKTKALSGFPRPIKSTGHFTYWREQGLYWETLKPFAHATTFKPDEVIHWKDGARQHAEQQNADAAQKHISRILLSIFNGNLDGLEDYFHIQWQDSDGEWRIVLEPSHHMVKKTLSNIQLSGGEYIETLDIINTNGDKTLISFANIHPLDIAPQDQCQFFLLANPADCK